MKKPKILKNEELSKHKKIKNLYTTLSIIFSFITISMLFIFLKTMEAEHNFVLAMTFIIPFIISYALTIMSVLKWKYTETDRYNEILTIKDSDKLNYLNEIKKVRQEITKEEARYLLSTTDEDSIAAAKKKIFNKED